MRRILTFLLFSCFFCINSTGQNSDCVNKEVVDTLITIPADKKTNEAHIRIEICYRKDKNISITLKRPYFITNGEKLTDQKAKRQGHQLFLKGISHYRMDLYMVKQNLDAPKIITDSVTFDFETAKNSYWVNDSIEFTFKFLYKKAGLKKGDSEQLVKIWFKLPDNPNPRDLLKKEKIDTIPVTQVVDSSIVSKIGKQSKSGKSIEPEPADSAGLGYKCLDSVIYYFKQLSGFYEIVTKNNKLSQIEKELLGKQFDFSNKNFLRFCENCDNLEKKIYKNQYDNIVPKLIKELNIGLEGNEVNVSTTNADELNIKKSFDIKDILFYVLAGFFLILVIAFIYSKIKKKRK